MRDFTKWIGTLVLVVLGYASLAAGADKPNVIIFLIDDMGLMDTSVPMLADKEGQPVTHPLNQWYRTPSMERLAAQGIRFSDFYAQNVCSPTRVSLLTGQNATRHRTTCWIRPDRNNRGQFGPPEWNWKGLTRSHVTLPRLLQQGGYRTLFVGKGHFGPKGSEGAEPLNLGFDVNIGGSEIGHPGSFYGQDGFGHLKGSKAHAVPHLEKYHGQDIYLSEALTIEANALLEKAVGDGVPFFLYLSHYAVHTPFHSDPRFAAHYADADKKAPAKAFATMIEGIDKSLGDILDQVDQLGVAEDTFVIFLGDNGSDAPLGKVKGYGSSAPLRGKKATEYEGGKRIPFIAGWAKPNPRNQWQRQLPIAGGRIQTQLGTINDIFPTVLALTGVERPSDHVIDGYDLRRQFTGERNTQRSETFLMHFPHEHRSRYVTTYRKGDWKLIYNYNPKTPRKPKYQLFNLIDDPREANNLSKSNPEKLRAMVLAMIAQLEAEGALYPVVDGQPLKPLVP